MIIQAFLRWVETAKAGDRAREMLPKAIQMSEERLCTVSRTVALGTPIDAAVADETQP